MDGDIERYIREHRGTYTREAIRQRLLEAGHPAEAIDAALAAGEAGATPAGAGAGTGRAAGRSPRPPLYWLVCIGSLIGLYLVSLILAGIDTVSDAALLIGGGLWLLLLFGGLALRGRSPVVADGLVAGMLAAVLLPVALLFVAVVVIGGYCLVMMTTQQGFGL